MTFDVAFLPVLILIAIVILTLLINRKYKFTTEWISTIKKLAPLFLIFCPALITYFFVCGSTSAIMVVIYSCIKDKGSYNREEFLLMEKCVEYLCSFVMPLIYFRILTKNKFPFFWSIVITIVHMLVAGYRDAKFLVLDPLKGKESDFQSGPIILQQIDLLDALISVFSFLVFYLVLQKFWPVKISEKNTEAFDAPHELTI